jgi:hypothetical protein
LILKGFQLLLLYLDECAIYQCSRDEFYSSFVRMCFHMFDNVSYHSLDAGIDIGTVDIGRIDIESLGLICGSWCFAAVTVYFDNCTAYRSEDAVDISQDGFKCLFDCAQE